MEFEDQAGLDFVAATDDILSAITTHETTIAILNEEFVATSVRELRSNIALLLRRH
jgi:hypothetical protein